MYFDIIRGRTRDQVRALLDSAQAAVESAWEGYPHGTGTRWSPSILQMK